MTNFEEMLLETIGFLSIGSPLAAGMVTIFESVEIEQELSGKRWLLIYIINSAAIFIINFLIAFDLGVGRSIISTVGIDDGKFDSSVKALILTIIYQIAFIIGTIVIKKIIKGSFTILPQNERDVNMLGKFIKEYREKLGLSCSELARRSGHPVSSIHGIETGANKNPRFQIIIDVANALGISLEEMKRAFENEQ